MIEVTERAQRIAAEIFPRDDEQARAAAMLIGRELQALVSQATCAYCGATVGKTQELMQAHAEGCLKHPARQLKLERARLAVLTDACVEMKEEFQHSPKSYHWALMRIGIALRDVDELKL